MNLTSVNGAKPDEDILFRSVPQGRTISLNISEHSDELIGMVFSHNLSDGIRELHHSIRFNIWVNIHCVASLTLTPKVAISRMDGEIASVGMRIH